MQLYTVPGLPLYACTLLSLPPSPVAEQLEEHWEPFQVNAGFTYCELLWVCCLIESMAGSRSTPRGIAAALKAGPTLGPRYGSALRTRSCGWVGVKESKWRSWSCSKWVEVCFPNEALTNWCLRVVGGYRHRLHNLPALERHHASQKGIGLKPNTSNSTNPLWVLSIKALAHQSSIFPEGLALFRVDVDRLLQEDWVWWVGRLVDTTGRWTETSWRHVLYRNINSFLMQVRFVEGYHLHTDEQCMLVGWELVDLAMMCWTWSALSCFHLNAKVTVQSHSISL